jgi:hypothetical protein
VVVKSGANKTETGGASMGARLKGLLESALGDSPEVTLDAKTASANRLSGFIIDGSITTMRKTTGTKWVELRCEVKLSISNSSGKMLSIVSGGATVQVPKASWKNSDEAKLWLTALENAVRGAHQNLVSYMTEQMASN